MYSYEWISFDFIQTKRPKYNIDYLDNYKKVLSYLPTIFGTALSVSLIQYSKSLSYVGLLIVLGFAGISASKLRSESKEQQQNGSLKHNMNKKIN